MNPAISPIFDFQPRTRIVFGAGAIEQLGELVRQYGGTRVLLVTDPGIVAAGHVQRAENSLAAAGVHVARFDRVVENPTTEVVDACVAVARQEQIDFLVGLGGGSSMDTAKGCNFLLTNGGRMEDYWGVGKATRADVAADRHPHHGRDGQRMPVLRPDHAPPDPRENGLRRSRKRRPGWRSSIPS